MCPNRAPASRGGALREIGFIARLVAARGRRQRAGGRPPCRRAASARDASAIDFPRRSTARLKPRCWSRRGRRAAGFPRRRARRTQTSRCREPRGKPLSRASGSGVARRPPADERPALGGAVAVMRFVVAARDDDKALDAAGGLALQAERCGEARCRELAARRAHAVVVFVRTRTSTLSTLCSSRRSRSFSRAPARPPVAPPRL